MYKVVLASNSPRRKEILSQVGIKFDVVPSAVEEKTVKTNPSEVVLDLSMQKADDVSYKVKDSAIIIGADTVVCIDKRILGKPQDEADAIRMVRQLQGRSHTVYTGVSVIIKTAETGYDRYEQSGLQRFKKKTIQFYDETTVTLNHMTEKEIEEYVKTGEPMDKAGAYAIQGRFASFVKGINGDYNNVVGFPISKLYQALKREGIDIRQ
ncbi:MAG: Maf family protein [bacterium]|nr:Maf family protein [bacterium]